MNVYTLRQAGAYKTKYIRVIMSIVLTATTAQDGVKLFSIPVSYADDGPPGTALVFRGGLRNTEPVPASASERVGARPPARRMLFVLPFPNPGGAAALDRVVLTPLQPWLPILDAMEASIESVAKTDMTGVTHVSCNCGGTCKDCVLGKKHGVPRNPPSWRARENRNGAYSCAVVANADALLAMDWAAEGFEVAADVDARLRVVRNAAICPPTCGFVIVQAYEDVDPKQGFAVLYPSIDVMLPTCRQASSAVVGHEGHVDVVEYDATCYVMEGVPVWLGTLGGCTSVVTLPPRLETAITAVDNCAHGIAGVDAATQRRTVRATISPRIFFASSRRRIVSRLRLCGSDVNANIFISGRHEDFDPARNAHLGPSVPDIEDARAQKAAAAAAEAEARAKTSAGVGAGSGSGAASTLGVGYTMLPVPVGRPAASSFSLSMWDSVFPDAK